MDGSGCYVVDHLPSESKYQKRPDFDLTRQRFVDRAFVGNLDQALALLVGQIALESYITCHFCHPALFGGAIWAIGGLRFPLAHPN